MNVFIEELNIFQNILYQELGFLVPTPYLVPPITVNVLMNGDEHGVKGVELLAVFGTSMSKGFSDNGVRKP